MRSRSPPPRYVTALNWVRRKKKYLWFRFHIVKKLGSEINYFFKIFFHGFGGFLLGDLQ